MGEVVAVLKNTATGEIREYVSQVEDQYLDGQQFWWTDGNASCDCNRSMFFAEVGGEKDPEAECGNERIELKALRINGVDMLPLDETYSEWCKRKQKS